MSVEESSSDKEAAITSKFGKRLIASGILGVGFIVCSALYENPSEIGSTTVVEGYALAIIAAGASCRAYVRDQRKLQHSAFEPLFPNMVAAENFKRMDQNSAVKAAEAIVRVAVASNREDYIAFTVLPSTQPLNLE